jgi:hypothetical protein
MMGSEDLSSPEAGLIPRICHSLLSTVSTQANTVSIHERCMSTRCEVAFIEIYNERVYDLLSSTAGVSCRVRQHPEEGAFVENLTKEVVTKYEDVHKILEEGKRRRRTAETLMNAESSRSHAVFIIYMFQKLRMENAFGSYSEVDRSSKVSLVDLAGSERASMTGAVGDRIKEASSINKSLSVLGDVIKALSEKGNKVDSNGYTDRSSSPDTTTSKSAADFIPYRNSILTWLLKDSLGGNSKTTMLATISPIERSYSETLSTLKYVERAKLIVNNAAINMKDNSIESAEVKKLMQQISVLKSQQAALIEQLKSHESMYELKTQQIKEETEQQFRDKILGYSKRVGVLENELSVAYCVQGNQQRDQPIMVDSSVPDVFLVCYETFEIINANAKIRKHRTKNPLKRLLYYLSLKSK